ncbi:MAG TPA: signal peptidase I [Rhizomicrobium sp.]|nr:signal peptidase I [Rhizomicrobium sp.]
MAMREMKRLLVRAQATGRKIRAVLSSAVPETIRTAATRTSPYIRPIWDFAKEPVLAVLFALAATTAIARPYYVPTGSMEPTIAIGDEVLASKFAYGYSRYSLPFQLGPSSSTRLLQRMPARGDVIVFQLPRDPGQAYVKRVIGLPGDRVQMRAGRVWLNGQELPLKFAGVGRVEAETGAMLPAARYIETLPGGRTHLIFKLTWNGPLDNTAVFVVPKGHLFMMGDNRDNSLDSRVSEADGGVGYVPMENLIGRADVVLGSVDFLNAPSLLDWPAEFRVARVLKRVH